MDRLGGSTLRDLREQRHISQARVARNAGVSVGHISRVEAGERDASPAGAVYALCCTAIFAIPAGYLYGLETGMLFSVLIGMGIGLAGSQSSLAALGFLILCLTGRFPLRGMRFLEDARRRGVLRTVGSGYQFRHARLQDQLAAPYDPQSH